MAPADAQQTAPKHLNESKNNIIIAIYRAPCTDKRCYADDKYVSGHQWLVLSSCNKK